ncbi:MAG TPA: alanine racemase [Gammaproteobacteria bacterium]|nr:alanine racemase [Gammaproteobacteria bacterium]
MSRATGAVINLAALRHNLRRVREIAPHSRIMAVVKANAYGHGITAVARALSETDAFAVASLDEALEIRRAGLAHPIVLLEGVFGADELDEAVRNGCEVVVHEAGQLALIEASRLQHALGVWLKVDSGMNRLGFPLAQARAAWQRLSAANAVRGSVRLMTHLACADDTASPRTPQQLQTFAETTAGIDVERSIANSAGILAWSDSHVDWVRPGILLYGVSPFAERCGADEGLLPVMTMCTELIAIRHLQKGEAVGYGGAWVAPEAMTIGIAAIGYGDGYPRHAPNGTPVRVKDQPVQLVGRVSMDMVAVDLRTVRDAAVGDPVLLWGPSLPVEQVAQAADTIPYELLCGVTQRVKFSIVDENETPAVSAAGV